VVDEKNSHLPTIVRVNGARSVQDGYTVLERQAAPRADLHLRSAGKFYSDPCLHQTELTGLDVYILNRGEVCTNGLVCLVHRGFGVRV
jgi:hypothetical protein